MNRDAKFINFSEVHELDYILKKYGKETSKENRDLLKKILLILLFYFRLSLYT